MVEPKACAPFVRIMQCLQWRRQRVISLCFVLVLGAVADNTWAAVGTVLVTAGNNTLEHANGSQQAVARGTEINNGDTVFTGAAGHLQIRFVDGAIIALRPNTDFRVDEYRYPAAPQRSFLSLLRGALRSATGLASKSDPDSYRLTTPSATIGVRGTHFVAQEIVCQPDCPNDERPGLHVSVSEGAIVVTNEAGTIELNKGQSARVAGPDAQPVRTARAPVLSPRRYQTGQPPAPETPTPAPTQLALGEPSEQSLRLPDNYEPAKQAQERPDESSMVARRVALEKSPVTGTLPPTTDTPPADQIPDADQNNTLVPDAGEEQATQGGWTIAGPDKAPATGAKDSPDRPSSQGTGSGRSGKQNTPFDDLPGAAANDPELANLPAAAEQINRSSATSTGFDLAGQQPAPDREFADDAGNLAGSPEQGHDDSSTDSGSGSNPPLTSPVTPPVTPSPIPAPGVAQADQWRIDLRAVPVVSRVGLVLNNQAVLAFDHEVRLTAIGLCPNAFCLSRGTATAAESGHDAFVAWGRWTDGSLNLRILGLETAIALSERDGLHYMVGVPAVSLPAQGTFSYPLIGATAPTTNAGWAPGQFTGAAAVQFAPGVAASVGLEGQIDIASERFSFATQGGLSNPGQSELSLNEQAGFSGTLNSAGSPGAPWLCGSGGCAVSVNGGLLGASGERLGLGYSVISESGSTTIEGVAVFGRQ